MLIKEEIEIYKLYCKLNNLDCKKVSSLNAYSKAKKQGLKINTKENNEQTQ